MTNGIKRKFLTGGLWVLTSTIIQNILQLLLLVILSRMLSPQDFGIVTISVLLTSLFSILAQLGIPQAIVQKETLSKFDIKISVTYIFITVVIISLLLNLINVPLSVFFNEENLQKIIPLITLTIFFQTLASIPEALIQRELKFKVISIVELFTYLISYGLVGIILAFILESYYALIIANLLYHFTRFISFIFIKPKSLIPSLNFKLKSDIIKIGIGFYINRIIAYFSIQSDNIIVGKLLGTELLGVYSRIYQLISLPAKITGMFFDKLLFSTLSRIQNNKEQTKKVYLLF